MNDALPGGLTVSTDRFCDRPASHRHAVYRCKCGREQLAWYEPFGGGGLSREAALSVGWKNKCGVWTCPFCEPPRYCMGARDPHPELREQQLHEAEVLVSVGKIAEVELVAAQAEVALRKEGLINARSDLSTLRLKLLRLINPPGMDLWTQEIVIKDEPTLLKCSDAYARCPTSLDHLCNLSNG